MIGLTDYCSRALGLVVRGQGERGWPAQLYTVSPCVLCGCVVGRCEGGGGTPVQGLLEEFRLRLFLLYYNT